MTLRVGHSIPTALIAVSLFLSVTPASAQKVVVDADPAHVANTFSPVGALGASIDRLRTGSPDHLLKDPLLKEILGAGWQTVTYRQNTELMVEAWHWNPAGKWSNADKQEGYFVGSAEPGSRDSSFVGVSAAASWIQPRRRQWMVAPDRRRSEVVLEEQSVSDEGVHRRR